MAAVPTLSYAGRIKTQLTKLNCADRPFLNLARQLGIKMGNDIFANAMVGGKDFPDQIGEQLLECAARMIELNDAVQSVLPVPVKIDWHQVEPIVECLTLRQAARILAQEHIDPEGVDQIAQRSTARVAMQAAVGGNV